MITEFDIPTSAQKQELGVMNGRTGPKIMSGLHGTGGIHDVQIDNAGNAG